MPVDTPAETFVAAIFTIPLRKLSLSLDEYHYCVGRGYRFRVPLKNTPWIEEDFGRRFRIRAKVMSMGSDQPRGTYVRVPYDDRSTNYIDEHQSARRLLHPEHTPKSWVQTELFYQFDSLWDMDPDIDKREVEIKHDAGTILVGELSVFEERLPVRITPDVKIVNSGLSHG